MAGNTTAVHAALRRAEVYSDLMLEQIRAGFLPETLHRDVSDFGDGDTLHIPVLGETVIRDYEEDTGVIFDALDSGEVTLTITEYKSAATYVTDKFLQDSYKAAALEQAIPGEHLYKIKKSWERDLLSVVNDGQTAADPNTINDGDHRWVAFDGSTDGVLSLDDVAYFKYVMDKAEAPEDGRILIVDPASEYHINSQVAAQAYINNPQFEGIVNTGFANNMRFVRNIFGVDIWVSPNNLKTVTDTVNGGHHSSSKSVTDGKAVVGMCVSDDMCKPIMGAWRQAPAMEGFRNTTFKRDEFSTTARWGFGLQRPETAVTILVNGTI